MQVEMKVNHNFSRKADNGFTLIELLATMAISIFLLSVAAPSISALNQTDRQTGVANTFIAALNTARSEAINRNARLSVCQSENGYECGTSGWDNGWMLFTDSGKPGEVDEDDTVLHFSESLPDDIQITSTNFENYISYFSDGTTNDSGSFKFCNSSSSSSAKSICITHAGRPTISAKACGGEEVTCL